MAIQKKKKTVSRTRTRGNYRPTPIYAYSTEGKLVGTYPSRHAYAEEHGVIPAAVTRALGRKGCCAGLRVLTKKVSSLPPIVKKIYPLFPSYPIYQYDMRGTPKGLLTEAIWNAMPQGSREKMVHLFKDRKTKKHSNMYYSLLQGAAVFARKSMSSKNGTRTKGGIIAISPSGKEHLYPQAADAALDLGLYEERICDALGGKLQSVGGYRFRRYTLAK